MSMFKGFCCSFLLVCATAMVASNVTAGESLTIGSTAPELDIEHWVQTGEGKFKPVTKFEKDKVYVVEFWATWCGPCIASMPHIVEMQKTYADKGVQIVSISDESLDTVEGFLDRKIQKSKSAKSEDKDVKDEEESTYRDLTKSYCLTTDPDGTSSKDYMEAAGQNGIPCAFVVGKDQKIEWIGHPMSMDEVLEAVVNDKWDRAAFAEKMKEDEKRQELMMEITNLVRRGKTSKALSKIESVLEETESPEMKMQLKLMRVQLVLQDKDSTDNLNKIVSETLKDFADNAGIINMVTWGVYEKAEAGDLDDKELMIACREAIQKASAKASGPEKGAYLDTVAHFLFKEGNLNEALAVQEEAVSFVSKDEQIAESMFAFLDELKAAAKKANK